MHPVRRLSAENKIIERQFKQSLDFLDGPVMAHGKLPGGKRICSAW
jgi:hypothetical protein